MIISLFAKMFVFLKKNSTLRAIEQQQVEGNLTYEEMLNSLKRMRNDSTPGNSGFTPAFYTFFLDRSWSFLSKICY